MPLSNPIGSDRYIGPAYIIRPLSKVNWRLALPNSGNYYLHLLELLSSDSGPIVANKLISYFEGSQPWHWRIVKIVVPFMVPTVYTASLSPVPSQTISHNLPCIVDIDAIHRCHVLTSAVRKAEALPNTVDFISSYSRFAVTAEAPESCIARDVLLIRLELHKVMLLAFVLSSIILSIIVGVVVGVVRNSLDAGLSVIGAILGIVGLVEGFLTWKLA